MASARIPRKRRHCLICKQPFQPIGDEQVCGRCEEQFVRRGRESIESEYEDTELEQKYVDVCLRRLEYFEIYNPNAGGEARHIERRVRESFKKGWSTDEAVADLVRNRPGCFAGCLSIVVIGIPLIGLSGLFVIHMLA